jgi:hypothetical protein
MHAIAQTRLTLMAAALALLPAIGCGIDVHEAERGKNVDIKSVLGDVSVRTNVDNVDTGLAVYPGAQPLRERGEDQSANVNVSSGWFGVKVVAAKYQQRRCAGQNSRVLSPRNEHLPLGDRPPREC